MKIEVDKKDLISLVKGSVPSFNDFEHPLVVKGGHSYCDQYGRTSWDSLDSLSENELYDLYIVLKNK